MNATSRRDKGLLATVLSHGTEAELDSGKLREVERTSCVKKARHQNRRSRKMRPYGTPAVRVSLLPSSTLL